MKRELEYLQALGLSEIEAKIYEGLLEKGQTTIMELANHIGLKRITTHFNVERLIEMGLVVQTRKGSRRQIIAEQPDKLESLIRQRESEVRDLRSQLPLVLDKLQRLRSSAMSSAEDVGILYYEGERGFKDVCQRSLDYANKEILFISKLSQWHQVYTYEYDQEYYIPTRLERDIQLRLLLPQSDKDWEGFGTDTSLLREARILPDVDNFMTTFIIYGSEVAIMLSVQPYTAIVVRNKEVTDSFRKLFYQLWGISRSAPMK